MGRIRRLSAAVVNQIAAGEVIERPGSVVKELCENSLDAGAKRIDIELEAGGTELIRVVDDGHGIEPDDLPLALSSHATSKLSTADDLFRIGTLGFRGEAIASIGGVSKFKMQSRAAGRPHGAEMECDGGETFGPRPWNGGFGTRVEVRHLFFNVPARKKFLKAIPTEVGHVTETVTRLALSHPDTHWTVRHNGRLSLEVPASADLVARVAILIDKELACKIYDFDATEDGVRAFGLVGDPACDKGSSRQQYLFVNGRWIRDRSLGHAMQEAYRGLIMTGRFPAGFVFLQMPPDMVDVNVHPTKAEVRFRDSSAIYHLVRSAVKRRLLRENFVPRFHVAESPMSAPGPRYAPASEVVAPWEVKGPPARGIAPEVVEDRPWLPPPEKSAGGTPAPQPMPEPSPGGLFAVPANTRAIQIHDSYLVVESPDGVLVVDQHALHERILFEQFQQRFRSGQLEVQRLLIPEPFDLKPDQAAAVLDCKTELETLGFEVGEFGGGTVILASYPTLLGKKPPAEVFQGVIDAILAKDRAPSRDRLLHDLTATMACKAAVKAGDPLTPNEIDALMELRQMAEDSHHCPHGRPTSLLLSRADLEKQFRRV